MNKYQFNNIFQNSLYTRIVKHTLGFLIMLIASLSTIPYDNEWSIFAKQILILIIGLAWYYDINVICLHEIISNDISILEIQQSNINYNEENGINELLENIFINLNTILSKYQNAQIALRKSNNVYISTDELLDNAKNTAAIAQEEIQYLRNELNNMHNNNTQLNKQLDEARGIIKSLRNKRKLYYCNKNQHNKSQADIDNNWRKI